MIRADVQAEWDYSEHAAWYRFRPNYAPAAIDRVVERVGPWRRAGFITADVGAGTGNLSVLLLERRVAPIVAVEPNAAMRALGQAATASQPVVWTVGTGEATGLADAAVDWFAMGSSFNTTRREECLREAARVLRPGGWFTCLWNNRELEGDPVQREVEAIIRRHVPDYAHGTRREDQTSVIAESGLFEPPAYDEAAQEVSRTVDEYLGAWRSVKNPFWDVATAEGRALLERIERDVRAALGARPITLLYRTRSWSARLR
ncbi:MAG: methyltransferase domain-containing protein [Planctomycetota bacterium]|nr:methyltransferase domain-containing protein [Planctomycetota bacterium]